MPKSIARIWLEVTDIRIERLHDITEEDAESEGIEVDDEGLSCFDYILESFSDMTPVDSFESLWIKINGQESWETNPWVWVVSFKVLSTSIKPVDLLL